MPLEIITLENPERFAEFVYKLNQKMPGTIGCQHNFDLSIGVLTEMGAVDVFATLEYLRNRGGYCDCEVMLNAVPWTPDGRLGEDDRGVPDA